MNLQIAPKLRIINSASKFDVVRLAKTASGSYAPITVTGVAATDAAATDLFKIIGFADLYAGSVTSAIKTLGIAGQKQTTTLTVTAGTIVNNKEFTIKLVTKTNNLEHEFVRFDGHNQKDRYYNLILKTGDTPTTIAARIAALIQYDDFTDAYKFVNATSSAGVVTLVGESEGWEFECFFEGPAIEDGNVSIAQAVTVKSFEGRNVYRQLNTKRLESDARTYAYAAGAFLGADEVPVEGGLYTSFIINFNVSRTDLSHGTMINSGPVTGEFAVELFVLQGAADAQITLLTDWLKANAKRLEEYTATTANAAIVAETPTVTTN